MGQVLLHVFHLGTQHFNSSGFAHGANGALVAVIKHLQQNGVRYCSVQRNSVVVRLLYGRTMVTAPHRTRKLRPPGLSLNHVAAKARPASGQKEIGEDRPVLAYANTEAFRPKGLLGTSRRILLRSSNERIHLHISLLSVAGGPRRCAQRLGPRPGLPWGPRACQRHGEGYRWEKAPHRSPARQSQARQPSSFRR